MSDQQITRAEYELELLKIQQQDPDGLGAYLQPAQYRDARWITNLWQAHCEPGMHLRAIFYRLLSKQVMMPPGVRQHARPGRPVWDPTKDTIALPLENSFWHWTQILNASVQARYAWMVSPHELEEHRSPEPQRHFYPRDTPVPSLTWIEEAIPRPQVIGYDYDGILGADQGYQVEVWCEKSSMDHILEPLHTELNFNYQPGQGYSSIKRVDQLLRRARKDRPIRLFAITDFDGSGCNMPHALADQIKKLIIRYPGVIIKVVQLALTEQQVRQFKLPYNMIDPEKVEKGLKKVFADKYPDLGPVELDALEAIVPGELERMVREAVDPFIDTQLARRLATAEDDAQAQIDEEWSDAIAAETDRLAAIEVEKEDADRRVLSEQAPLDGQISDIHLRSILEMRPYQRAILAIQQEAEADMAPLDEAKRVIAQRVHVEVIEPLDAEHADLVRQIIEKPFTPVLIERPEPEIVEDEVNWLYEA